MFISPIRHKLNLSQLVKANKKNPYLVWDLPKDDREPDFRWTAVARSLAFANVGTRLVAFLSLSRASFLGQMFRRVWNRRTSFEFSNFLHTDPFFNLIFFLSSFLVQQRNQLMAAILSFFPFFFILFYFTRWLLRWCNGEGRRKIVEKISSRTKANCRT